MEHSCCLNFVDAFILDDVVKQFSFFDELHDEKQLFGGLYDFVKLHYVRMPDKFQYMDFSRDSFNVCYFSYFAFLENFDSDILVGRLVDRWFDFTESALADRLAWINKKVPMR